MRYIISPTAGLSTWLDVLKTLRPPGSYLVVLFIALLSVEGVSQVDTTYMWTKDVNQAANFASAAVKDDYGHVYVSDIARGRLTPDNNCLSLYKLDDRGHVLWDTCYEWRPDRSYRAGGWGCIDRTSDEIVIAGDEDWRRTDGEQDRFFLAFFDTSGTLLDTFFFKFPIAEYQQFVRGVLAFSDSVFYAFGSHEVPSGNYSPAFLSKITRDCREVWRKFYFDRLGIFANPEHLALMDDSTLLLSYTDFSAENPRREPLIAAIDTSGALRWEYAYVSIDSTWGDGLGQINAVPDGAGGAYFAFKYDSLIFWHEAYVVRLGPSGDEIWEYVFPRYRGSGIRRIASLSNGDMVGIGFKNPVLEDRTGYIFRISRSGELLWQYDMADNIHGSFRSAAFLDAIELKGGNILFFGTASDTANVPGSQNALFLRVGADGSCLSPSCPEMLLVYSSTNESEQPSHRLDDLTIFPNPADAFVNVEDLPRESRLVTAYDMQGVLVRNWLLMGGDDQEPLDVKGMPAGTYVLLVRSKHGRPLARGRFVKGR